MSAERSVQEETGHDQVTQRRISDPDMMRALAHPTRIALIEALHLNATLTATQASKIIGESPTNCAFHLRTLGKFGIVEEVKNGSGRRRPWRIKDVPLAFSEVQNDKVGTQAATELAQVLLQRWLVRTRDVQALRHLQAPEWQEALGGSQGIVIGTADEIRELVDELRRILDRYANRLRDASSRPRHSQPIEILIFAQPFIPSSKDVS